MALFTEMNDRRGLANALGLLALCGPSTHSSATTPFLSPAAPDELAAPQSVRIAHEIGWRAGESFLRFVIADCLCWRGDYGRALPLAREALSLAEEIEHLEWTAGANRLLGAIALDLLAPHAARAHLEEAHRAALKLGSLVWIRWTAGPLAVARGRTSDWSGALEVLAGTERIDVGRQDNAPPPPGPGDDGLTLGERLIWLARAELALAQRAPETALEIADARIAWERAARPGSVLGVPRLSLVKGEALASLGRHEEAERTLEQARREATMQDARPLLLRIEAAFGHLHRAQRRRLEARRAFDTARAIADELAATIPDEQLRASFLEGLPSIIPSASPPSPGNLAKSAFGGLTRRERDVTRLVAKGKPNRAIGQELGIGERTVEGYVASALAKLGFASRTQLAAWAVEMGIDRAAILRPVR